METLSAGELQINVTESDSGDIRLDWLGKSNDRQPGAILAPFFEQVARQAEESKLAIEMHFEGLEHFNSSTITALIQLIQRMRERRIRLVIVFDARLKWQKLSFDALRIFEKPDGLLAFRQVEED